MSTILKCKMCGGNLEFEPNATIGVCDSCGTKQTLPKIDSERRANLYDRASHFRRNNEFDKAAGLYEQILNEDGTDAEAYWSLVLCRYGIEYVEDPATHKRIPTVNRAQYTSIYDDKNYKSALEYADSLQKSIYEEEANSINEIQKGILEISGKEDPFDIFICYKETDANGRRTPDSVLATDLYHQLTKEGYKVFFSRITLEDKIGTAYEPYIFAALNSAKVMVVLGTKAEYFNAVWVKNEWSRFLTLVKESGGEKVLIPAFRDMDPYDLPEEFSHLQALDMSKLGFMQDLVRGIKKITQKEENHNSVSEVPVGNFANISSLIKRVFLFIEDGNFADADVYCERVLDQDPENADAYLGKLLAEQGVNRIEDLQLRSESFESSNNYQKIIRFGDEKIVSQLKTYIDRINERNERNRIQGFYSKATSAMAMANTESEFKSAAEIFASIIDYGNSEELMKECLKKAEESRKDSIYEKAKNMIRVKNYSEAKSVFETIIDWKDSSDQVKLCEEKIEEVRQKEIQRKEHKKKALQNGIKSFVAIVALAVAIVVTTTVIIPYARYKRACSLMEERDYVDAAELFEKIGKKEQEEDAKKKNIESLIEQEKYQEAHTYAEREGMSISKLENEIARIEIVRSGVFKELASAKVGDTIDFGGRIEKEVKTSEYNIDVDSRQMEIEWIVAENNNGRILLIAKSLLSKRNFKINNSWEHSEWREYLNGKYIEDYFSDEEKSVISEIELESSVFQFQGDSGEDSVREVIDVSYTTDKVFLLGVDEAYKYFPEQADRGEIGVWLLRDSTIDHQVLYINRSGNLSWSNPIGFSYDDRPDVRPAMWIDLSEDVNLESYE